MFSTPSSCCPLAAIRYEVSAYCDVPETGISAGLKKQLLRRAAHVAISCS